MGEDKNALVRRNLCVFHAALCGRLKRCPAGSCRQRETVPLLTWRRPDTCHLPMSDLMDAISLDKKNLNNHLNLVLLHQIGDSYVYPADLTFFDQADEI